MTDNPSVTNTRVIYTLHQHGVICSCQSFNIFCPLKLNTPATTGNIHPQASLICPSFCTLSHWCGLVGDQWPPCDLPESTCCIAAALWVTLFVGHWFRLWPVLLHARHTMSLLLALWYPRGFLHSLVLWLFKPQLSQCNAALGGPELVWVSRVSVQVYNGVQHRSVTYRVRLYFYHNDKLELHLS